MELEGTLFKREDRWDLYSNKDGSKIGSSAPNPFATLSVKNCEDVARGYNLEELTKSALVPVELMDKENSRLIDAMNEVAFKSGFLTRDEMLSEKQFTASDILKAIEFGVHVERETLKLITKSIKQLKINLFKLLSKRNYML